MIDNVRNGSADPPGGSDDADQDEGNENVFNGLYSGESHICHFPDAVFLVQAVPEKQEESKHQCRQNRDIKTDADHQGTCKQGENTNFRHFPCLQNLWLSLYAKKAGVANKIWKKAS